MLAINYAENVLSLTDTQNSHFDRFTHIWTKEEFAAQSGIDPSPYSHVVYEPERNEFCVVAANAPTVVEKYDLPSQHPALNWIHEHRDLLLSEAERQHAESVDYAWDGVSAYVPKRSLMTLTELRADLISEVNLRGFGYVQVILALNEVGNLVPTIEITAQVNARLNSVRSWVVNHRNAINTLTTVPELLAYEIQDLESTAEADIDFVFNQL